MNDYPRECVLKEIAEYNILEDGVQGYLDLIKRVWHTPDWGFRLAGKRVLRLYLSTGGCSDNEEIIAAMQENLFWLLHWQRSDRGGHYYFKIRPPAKTRKKKP